MYHNTGDIALMVCRKGHKAPTDADAWTIVDGKLYLN